MPQPGCAGQEANAAAQLHRMGEGAACTRRNGLGVDNFFTTLYNIYCNKKLRNNVFKTKRANILYYITGETYGYFSEML